MDAINKLERALEQSYLLHGSPHIIQRFELRQAHDTASVDGNRKAVYATNNLVVAVFKGLIHGKGDNYRSGWAWSESQKELFGENIGIEGGYVYILESSTFQPNREYPDEFFSLVPVRPTERVEVTTDDLLSLQSELGFTLDIR